MFTVHIQLDYRLQHKYTMVGLCSGTIAGLVAATPSSGYIPIWASVILGVVTGAVCNYSTKSTSIACCHYAILLTLTLSFSQALDPH